MVYEGSGLLGTQYTHSGKNSLFKFCLQGQMPGVGEPCSAVRAVSNHRGLLALLHRGRCKLIFKGCICVVTLGFCFSGSSCGTLRSPAHLL